jgi:hypothetical protein
MKPIQTNAVNQTLRATVYNTDGTIKTDLAYNTAGISIYIQKIGVADGSPLTLSDKATPATAHADGAFLNLGGGDVSVDVPDASFSSFLGEIRIYGTFTGGIIVGDWYPVVAYNPDAVAVGANTIAPATLADVQGELPTNFGDLVINESGHIGRVVLVDTTTTNTDMRGTDGASTHSAANVLTALGTGTWATAIPWNAAWDAEVQSEVNDALVALDLDSALIAQGAERAVNVDVNHRVHSHVYDMQANTITASALAADAVAEIQSGLATSACDDRLGYVLAALAGACADAGTAAETYTITIGADTFTIDHTGLDATGNRGTAVLTKS